MKRFFQGLVLGAALMYGYLYHGAYLLGQLQHWLSYSAGLYRDDRRHEEAEKALHGLLLQRGLRYSAEKENAFG
jgi:hypothetical protein